MLVYGTVCLDRIRHVVSLPKKGGYAEILREHQMLGGEASNTACALSAWGQKFELFGNALGIGHQSDFVRQCLADRGLLLVSPDNADHPAPFCDIYVTADGDRTIYGFGFLRMEDEVDPSLAPYQRGEWFTSEPNHGLAACRAIELAAAAGMKIYLQDFVLPGQPIPAGCVLQSSTDWAGKRGNIQKNLQWVEGFAKEHHCTTILSDGPNGFTLALPDGSAHAFPPFPCPMVVDSTGAGDVFRAGMLFGLDQGWPLGRCLAYASAAGCLNCRDWGGNQGIPSREEIEELIRANPSVARHYEFDLSVC
ncbi:MAG: carbohydrate kinase family protein [Chthonomonas sp.]|nr:carbohydrate kinase family protein [Chthonomonas sp.]